LRGLSEELDYHIEELNVEKSSSWFSGKTLPGSMLINKGLNPPVKQVYQSAVFLLEAK